MNILEKKKIKCFASIFAKTELNDYLSITKDFVKIPSHEAYNLDLVKECIKKFKLVFISCGCLKLNELKKLIKLTKSKKNVILMHCVSSYPLTSENCNFKKFDYLKNFFLKWVILVTITVWRMFYLLLKKVLLL